ncbi:hypothetical protein CCAX7_61750 [Capsulimonas corticalis]|uniref:Uncharacterized protein n=1 Tax=Capsulimonas corticalis TaxID=2219043 RepID=A0A402CWF6_9BACT|nr:hypothetical protein [Capsulimonas corticalis]BDI34124.1 hypothetical protein CCAX7_61750 [Capsulimonas corticalis]
MPQFDRPDGTAGIPIGSSDGDAVAYAFLEDLEKNGDDERTLKAWFARYPDHAEDLTELAVCRHLTEDTETDSDAEVEERIGAVGDQVLAVFFPGFSLAIRAARNAVPPLTNLLDRARSLGIQPRQLAATLRIDTTVLAKLNQRRIDLNTIPIILVDRIAEQLDYASEAIVTYLRSDPRLSAQASYKARSAPRVSDSAQESFADALSTASSLTEADREFWTKQLEV